MTPVKVKDYTDAYLRARWLVIQRREKADIPNDPEDVAEVKAEMLKRGFDIS